MAEGSVTLSGKENLEPLPAFVAFGGGRRAVVGRQLGGHGRLKSSVPSRRFTQKHGCACAEPTLEALKVTKILLPWAAPLSSVQAEDARSWLVSSLACGFAASSRPWWAALLGAGGAVRCAPLSASRAPAPVLVTPRWTAPPVPHTPRSPSRPPRAPPGCDSNTSL